MPCDSLLYLSLAYHSEKKSHPLLSGMASPAPETNTAPTLQAFQALLPGLGLGYVSRDSLNFFEFYVVLSKQPCFFKISLNIIKGPESFLESHSLKIQSINKFMTAKSKTNIQIKQTKIPGKMLTNGWQGGGGLELHFNCSSEIIK